MKPHRALTSPGTGPLDVRYSLPPVDLRKADIEWLWTELRGLMQPPPVGFSPHSANGQISGSTGKGSNEVTIEDSDAQRFLQSGLLGDLLNDLALSWTGWYRDAKGSLSTENRSVRVTIGGLFPKVRVNLRGEPDWIPRVRGSLDPYLRNRRRKFLGQRIATVAALAWAPASAMTSLALRLSVGSLALTAFLWGMLGSVIAWIFAEGLYPAVLIVLNERGLDQPWYIRWARQVYLIVIVPSALTILLSLLWPR